MGSKSLDFFKGKTLVRVASESYMGRSHRRFVSIIAIGILLTFGSALAQIQRCADIVQKAFASVDQFCEQTSRNEACYGNISMEVEPQPTVTDFNFSQTGDIESVGEILSMHLDGMDELKGVWGLALMRVQASLPDSLPGQNATIILFGDVEIEQHAEITENPMQAFYLQTGLGHPRCSEVPQHGLLIQTPEGAREVAFNINGLDIVLGSTVLFQASVEEGMTITPIEGSAVVEMDGKQYPVVAGTQIHIPLNENLEATGTPSLPASYTEEAVNALPIQLLEREIETAPPMPESALQKTLDYLLRGEAPCGTDGLADCDSMLPVVDRIADVATGILWNVVYDPVLNAVVPLSNTLDPVTGAVSDTLEPVADAVSDTLEPVTDAVGDTVSGVTEALPVEETLDNVTEVIEPVTDAIEPVTEAVGDTVEQVTEPITEPVQEVLEPIGDAIAPVGDALEPVGDVVDPIGDALAPVGEALEPVKQITEPVTNVVEPITDVACKPLGGLLNLVITCDED